MSFDYDMFVINSENKDTEEYQLRDCIKDAFERLEKRLTEQEKLMEVMVSHLDTQSKLNQNFWKETEKLKESLKPTAADVANGTFIGNLAVKKALDKSCEQQVETARKAEEAVSKTENTTWPKEGDRYWFIFDGTMVDWGIWGGCQDDIEEMAVGNVFRTEEEAKLAIKKLKALKRLRDKGLVCAGWYWTQYESELKVIFKRDFNNRLCDEDLDILFEEEEFNPVRDDLSRPKEEEDD